MWFLAGLFAGVILGFLLAGLCNIAAHTDDGCIARCSDLERKIEEVA
jgi:hypothetical protein